MTFTRLLAAECPRCAELVLTGTVAGLALRVEHRTIPRADAAVLARYGLTVLRIDRRSSGLWADFYHPTDTLPEGALLALVHRCNRRPRC